MNTSIKTVPALTSDWSITAYATTNDQLPFPRTGESLRFAPLPGSISFGGDFLPLVANLTQGGTTARPAIAADPFPATDVDGVLATITWDALTGNSIVWDAILPASTPLPIILPELPPALEAFPPTPGPFVQLHYIDVSTISDFAGVKARLRNSFYPSLLPAAGERVRLSGDRKP